jgi:hypothetical protein
MICPDLGSRTVCEWGVNAVNAMPAGSGRKRERHYEHSEENAMDRGESEQRAEEIDARTVDKERAHAGRARRAPRTTGRTRRPGAAPSTAAPT